MVMCDVCGETVIYVVRCNYCGGEFCDYHHQQRRHNCAGTHTNVSYKTHKFNHPTHGHYIYKKRQGKNLLIAFLAIMLLLSVTYIVTDGFQTIPHNPIQLNNTKTDTTKHEELVNYALDLINTDRKQHGLQSVTLSSINSAQLHAEEMLKVSYFSHWSLNGYKPYMRYTLAGGKGAASENCACILHIGSIFGPDVKSALKDMEYSMMYDDAHSNWGHRDNILNPMHNKVSIGIAYNRNNIYFVQDFENDYIAWNNLSTDNPNQIILQGTNLRAGTTIQNVMIFYDNPTSLTVDKIKQAPYQGSYSPGTYVATVWSPPPAGTYYTYSDNTIHNIEANTWIENGNNFQISYSLVNVINSYGKGVYTIYLIAGSSTAESLTTYSIWIT
jgi:hypothetical protein